MDQINVLKIIYDLIVLALLFVLYLILKYVVEPFKSGFYCNDFSVNVKYYSSTISNTILLITAIPVPILLFTLTEVGRTIYMKIKSRSLEMNNQYRIKVFGLKTFVLPEQIGNVIVNLIGFYFGLLCTLILTIIGKKTIGRLRPNFLSVCQPPADLFTNLCNTAVSGNTYLIPEVDFQCNNPDKADISESRLSFPSGHSSQIFFTGIFLILYINRAWNKRTLGLIPQFVQFMIFAFSFFTAISRVMNNKHHPTDVAAGTAIGVLMAIFSYYYLVVFYRRYNFKSRYNSTLEPSQADNYSMNDKKSSDIKSV